MCSRGRYDGIPLQQVTWTAVAEMWVSFLFIVIKKGYYQFSASKCAPPYPPPFLLSYPPSLYKVCSLFAYEKYGHPNDRSSRDAVLLKRRLKYQVFGPEGDTPELWTRKNIKIPMCWPLRVSYRTPLKSTLTPGVSHAAVNVICGVFRLCILRIVLDERT